MCIHYRINLPEKILAFLNKLSPSLKDTGARRRKTRTANLHSARKPISKSVLRWLVIASHGTKTNKLSQ